ncbi:transforming acidic coiled-coil-containing protein 2 isoform X8 [Alligator sinensis]|uniref:Transforming acidic coiled-coil-containing protein 2 isoform X8 n=1 Tax=Alligator sinensis TaxID=38654 RepID=A0A3Q0GQL3_ALLSI|nr:transforming acidic coiled-coil-containing protein 2 isoform X8 [Alligator sinensis]
MGNENSSAENQSEVAGTNNVILMPPNQGTQQSISSTSTPESGQPPGNGQDVKKKHRKKKSAEKSGGQDALNFLPDTAAPLAADVSPLITGCSSPGRESWSVVFDLKEDDPQQGVRCHNLLFAGLDIKEDASSQTPAVSSIGNEGICSYTAEDLLNPHSCAVSSAGTGQSNTLKEHGEQVGSSFLIQAAGADAKERSLPISMPFAECANEYVAADLTGSSDDLPAPNSSAIVFSPVNDKDLGVAHALFVDSGPKRDNTTAYPLKKSDDDPKIASLESSPSTEATWIQDIIPANSSELQPLWQSEQLGDKREPHVISLPQGKAAEDYFTTQEEPGFLEVGHQEQNVIQLGGQHADGREGLLMKEETLILNHPTTEGPDSEKYGAVVNAQNLVDNTELGNIISLGSGDITAGKGVESNQPPSENNGKQLEACTLMPGLALNLPELFLVPKVEDPLRECMLVNECQDPSRHNGQKPTSKTPKPMFERQVPKVDLFVHTEPFNVPPLPLVDEEQKLNVSSGSREDQGNSNRIVKPESVSGESITLSNTENIMSPTLVDERRSPENDSLSFTSGNITPELHLKETDTTVPGEKNEVFMEEDQAEEAQVAQTRGLPEGFNEAEGLLLNFINSDKEDMKDASLGEVSKEINFSEQSLKTNVGEKAEQKPMNSESGLEVSEDKILHFHCKLQQVSKDKAIAMHNLEDKCSFPLLEAPQLPREESLPSCNHVNSEKEDKSLDVPGSKMTEKVCLVNAHSSLPLHPENNNIMQTKQDESWEQAGAKETILKSAYEAKHHKLFQSNGGSEENVETPKIEPEFEGLCELAGTADCIAVKIRQAFYVYENKEQNNQVTKVPESDPEQIRVNVIEQSSTVEIKDNNGIAQEHCGVDVKSFVDDQVLALTGACKSDTLLQVWQEQGAAERNKSVPLFEPETPKAAANTVELSSQQTQGNIEELRDSKISGKIGPSECDKSGCPEPLESDTVEMQEMTEVSVTLLHAEQRESTDFATNSIQEHASYVGLEKKEHQSNLTAVIAKDGDKCKATAPKHEHVLEKSYQSDLQDLSETSLDITGSIQTEPPVLGAKPFKCHSDATKGNDLDMSTAGVQRNMGQSEHLQKNLDLKVTTLQEYNDQTKTDLKAEEICVSGQALGKPEQENDSLISVSNQDEACQNDPFSQASDINLQVVRTTDRSGESGVDALDSIAEAQDSVNATDIPQTVPTDFKVSHAGNGPEQDKNDTQIPSTETQEKIQVETKSSDLETAKELTSDREIMQKDDSTKTNFERDVAATEISHPHADTVSGAQEYPTLQEHLEVAANNALCKLDCVKKTPNEPQPVSCLTEIPFLSTSVFALDHQSTANQEPLNIKDDSTAGESLNNGLEVTTRQSVLEANSDLQDASKDILPGHLEGSSPHTSQAAQNSIEVVHLENTLVENTSVKETTIHTLSCQPEGENILTSPETADAGQFSGNLSEFNFEKLKKEISAIKSKGTKSDVNFKAQQSDSSAESLFSLPTLGKRASSLSSVGKQEECNEEIATNICTDDKCTKILEKPGSSEKKENVLKEANGGAKPDTDISKQSAENSEREHEVPISKTFGFGASLPDFREHISNIFKKTVHGALNPELPQLRSENHADSRQSSGLKDAPERRSAESFSQPIDKTVDGNIYNTGQDSDFKTEGQELPVDSEISSKVPEQKSVQQEDMLLHPKVQDIEEQKQPCSFSEKKDSQLDGFKAVEQSPIELLELNDSPNSEKMEREENSRISSVDDGAQVSLEVQMLESASFDETTPMNVIVSHDNNQQPTKTGTSSERTGTAQERDLESVAVLEAENCNLIRQANAEPVLVKEDLILYGNQCQKLMPNEQKKSKESEPPSTAQGTCDMSASTEASGDFCKCEVEKNDFPMSPSGNQEIPLPSNLMHDIKSEDNTQIMPDALENKKCLEMLDNIQDPEQKKESTVHGLIDYLINEVSHVDRSRDDSKKALGTVNKRDVKEQSDTTLSAAEIEASMYSDKQQGDILKTGIAGALFTGENTDFQASIQDQGTYTKTHPWETITGMEQEEHFASTNVNVENQQSEMHLDHKSSSQTAEARISAESNFPEPCHSLLPVPEKDAIAVTAKAISEEARNDIRVERYSENSPVPGDDIQLASSSDFSKQPLAVSPSCEHAAPLAATELTAASTLEPGSCKEAESGLAPVPEDVSLAPAPITVVEPPAQDSEGLTREIKRSSDSEEAFETPESTTPVKAPPAPPQPPPEAAPAADAAEQEIRQPLPSEDTGFCSDTVSITDVSHSESVEESPFRPPSHSFSAVFDEDKPIASSGTYNLDFDNIELVDSFHTLGPSSSDAKNRDPKANVRRKSTDSVPVARSTLSRSLSLQASDFDGASYLGNNETVTPAADVYNTGSSSACSTLKRTKKPRPASIKKKQSAKKPADAPPVKEVQQEPSDTSIAVSPPCEEKPVSDTKVDSVKPECPEPSQISAEKQEIPAVPEASYPFDPDNFEGISAFSTGSKVQNSPSASKKTLPLTTAPEAVEVTPSDTGGQEDPPVKGLAVRLEFDYSEEKGSSEDQPESTPPPKKVGKKPGAKMPLRRPKTKKTVEKLDNAPTTPTKSPTDPNDIPITKGSYTFDIDKWDDPNFNPFSSSTKMQESPKLPQQTYSFDPDMCEDSVDPFKSSCKIASSPSKSPASFEIPANASETNGTEGDNLNKPAKKKKTPLKTDTFRVKKSPKRSPLSDPPSKDSTPLPTPETPPVISTVVHATDEEKLASSVTSQKWTCMTVDLNSDKQDYPEPSDLSTFVNETKFNSPTEELDYGNSYEIEYMEKIGSSVPDDSTQKKQSLYLMFDAQQESPVKSPPVRLSDSTTPCSGSSFEETEAQLSSGMKIQHPASRALTASQETHLQAPDKSKQKDLEPMTLGTASETIEITSPEDSFVSADALLNRISQQTSLSNQPEYLDPDLAEKNPPVFAQKLQREPGIPADIPISKSALYSRISTSDAENTTNLHYPQQDVDSSLRLAREEIVAKEREVSEWKEKYEESRREVMEMRKIVSEYEKTIAQMIEDEQREKSVSHHTVQQLIVEKEQALADLNSVEKSLADLFRRYEKMKEVLEGFRKNEEVLKKCAQEYLSRVKKEEQRYQALKVHAEEKLDRANAEIAQVRSKAQQEQAAYQASLRKEQLKVDALERTLEQKNKEIEELTKICDELIAKMGKS